MNITTQKQPISAAALPSYARSRHSHLYPTHAPTKMLVSALLTGLLLTGCDRAPKSVVASEPSVPATTTIGNDIDDTVLTTKVKAALLGDQALKGFDIKVETRKGVVQLSGFVETQALIDQAVSLARNVSGTKNVENSMAIKRGSMSVGDAVDDSVITMRVKSALLADSLVSSADITVVTRKAEVQLSGFVGSKEQIERAVSFTAATPDVQKVINQLRVKK
jgi:hyperosmotically inducible protein